VEEIRSPRLSQVQLLQERRRDIHGRGDAAPTTLDRAGPRSQEFGPRSPGALRRSVPVDGLAQVACAYQGDKVNIHGHLTVPGPIVFQPYHGVLAKDRVG